MSGIGTLSEGPLHAALKETLAEPGDQHEVELGDFVIDLVRPGELVEIQTGSFGRMRRKLETLLPEYRMRIVYPLAYETRILKCRECEGGEYEVLDSRKSPRRKGLYHIFDELTSIPGFLRHPHFRLELVSVRIDEVRIQGTKRAWRRKGWQVAERRLIEVLDATLFDLDSDWLKLMPEDLPSEFDTSELASCAGITRSLAQKLCYTYLNAGLLDRVDKRGNAWVYSIT